MTFTLTEQCLFCGKCRIISSTLEQGKDWQDEMAWATLLSVFETREKDGHTHRIRLGAGTVVTVCRECRPKYTVEDLIREARKIW
jgi:hypothetical protein